MELVTGATNSLLPKLGALLQDEYNLQDKVGRDIESLQNELVFMNATLRMVAEVPRDELDEHVQIWAVFIKDLSYDMEDVVSTFVARVHRARHLNSLVRKVFNMLCMGRTHHEIAGMVEEIKSLIKEVADLRDRYRLDSIVTRPATPLVLPQRDNTLLSSLAAEYEDISHRPIRIKCDDPVGIEEDIKVLYNRITSGENHGGMLYILGSPGKGKTTIAMALYQKYGDHFERHAMVNVTQHYGCIDLVLMDILSQVKPQELQGHNGDYFKIITELQECLQGNRFLVLVDDVHSATTLSDIKEALPNGEEDSIIVTTRFSAVARAYEDTGDYVHEVGLLSDEKAKQLFIEVVGEENGSKIPSRLWEMCGGLPLAIVIMAGQVACNPE